MPNGTTAIAPIRTLTKNGNDACTTSHAFTHALIPTNETAQSDNRPARPKSIPAERAMRPWTAAVIATAAQVEPTKPMLPGANTPRSATVTSRIVGTMSRRVSIESSARLIPGLLALRPEQGQGDHHERQRRSIVANANLLASVPHRGTDSIMPMATPPITVSRKLRIDPMIAAVVNTPVSVQTNTTYWEILTPINSAVTGRL